MSGLVLLIFSTQVIVKRLVPGRGHQEDCGCFLFCNGTGMATTQTLGRKFPRKSIPYSSYSSGAETEFILCEISEEQYAAQFTDCVVIDFLCGVHFSLLCH